MPKFQSFVGPLTPFEIHGETCLSVSGAVFQVRDEFYRSLAETDYCLDATERLPLGGFRSESWRCARHPDCRTLNQDIAFSSVNRVSI